MEHLAEAGIIEDSVFAFYLESYGKGPSFVDIGAIVPSHMRKGMEPIWLNLTPHMYWMVSKVSGVRYNHSTSFKWLKNENASYSAIFDSGTSLTMVPTDLYDHIIDKIIKTARETVQTWKQDQLTLVPCNAEKNLPVIELLIEDYWVEMHPHDYLVKSLNDGKVCMIGL